MKHATVIVVLLAWCISGALIAGCLENPAQGAGINQSAVAIALALGDSIVKEQIQVEAGEYEIVDVGPVQYEQTGPAGIISGTFTAVTFRRSGQRSLYRVIIDDANATILYRYWQYVKEPYPCSGGGPPVEYTKLEEALSAPGTACPLAWPHTLPEGYRFLLMREYGDPCPRRDIVHTRGTEELRLVQVCPGHPPYAFAITGKGTDKVVIRGFPGEFVEGIGQNQLAWTDAHGSYWLLGDMSREDLVAAASSVEPYTRADGTVSG